LYLLHGTIDLIPKFQHFSLICRKRLLTWFFEAVLDSKKNHKVLCVFGFWAFEKSFKFSEMSCNWKFKYTKKQKPPKGWYKSVKLVLVEHLKNLFIWRFWIVPTSIPNSRYGFCFVFLPSLLNSSKVLELYSNYEKSRFYGFSTKKPVVWALFQLILFTVFCRLIIHLRFVTLKIEFCTQLWKTTEF
jgi:hypothetical protein